MDDIDLTVELIEKLREQYPDDVYEKTVLEIVLERDREADAFIEKKRREYLTLQTFKEKQEYYKKHKVREQGYLMVKEAYSRYLQNPKPKPYESWVTPTVYDFMKSAGYKLTVEHHISFQDIL
jgi:hypothetical protein